MSGQLLSFFGARRVSPNEDWSSQEIAEFYRVEAALVQSGVKLSVDRGISDEGDPWFVFCRTNDGEVVIHFARIGGVYVIYADSISVPLRGSDFRSLLVEFARISSFPLPISISRGSNLSLHPAALLAAVVASALFHMSTAEAVASELDPLAVDQSSIDEHDRLGSRSTSGGEETSGYHERQYAAVLAAIVAVSSPDYLQSVQDSAPNIAESILAWSHNSDGRQIQDAAETPSAPPPQMGDDLRQHGLLGNVVLGVDGRDGFDVSDSDWNIAQHLNFDLQKPDSLAVHLITPEQQQPALLGPPASEPSDGGHHSATFAEGMIDIGGIGVPFLNLSNSTISVSGSYDQESQSVSIATAHVTSNIATSATTAALSTESLALTAQSSMAATLVVSELSLSNIHLDESISLNARLTVNEAINFAIDEVLSHRVDDNSVSGSSASTVQSAAPHASAAAPSSVSSTTAATATYTTEQFNSNTNAILDAFIRQTPTLDVLSSATGVVLFDADQSHYSNAEFVIRTWEMNDGSTISIVGIVPHHTEITA